MVIGLPPRTVMTEVRRSSSEVTRPRPVTMYSWSELFSTPPGRFRLAASTASMTSCSVRSYALSRRGDTTTWYCLMPPPTQTTEATPDTASRRLRMSHSQMVRRSSSDTAPSSRS